MVKIKFQKCKKCGGESFNEFSTEECVQEGIRIEKSGRHNYDEAGTIDPVGNGINILYAECEKCGEIFGKTAVTIKADKLQLTESEAQEIYYALESKIAPTGITSDDKKWKADIEVIMDKIGVDGVNLLTGDE